MESKTEIETNFTLYTCECLRCGWKWTPRISKPRVCPRKTCHSSYWNVPRSRPPKPKLKID